MAIVAADGPPTTPGTIQALCGRATEVIQAAQPLADVVLPVIDYLFVETSQTAASGDRREPLVQFDTWTDAATGGLDVAERLADRLEAILTEPNLRAQGIDAAPVGFLRRRDGTELEDELAAGRRRVTLEITFSLQRG